MLIVSRKWARGNGVGPSVFEKQGRFGAGPENSNTEGLTPLTDAID
jgi:hypothetical protein